MEPQYLYAGDAGGSDREKFKLVIGDNVPSRIVEAIDRAMSEALVEFETLLGVGLDFQPAFFVTFREGDKMGWRGDVAGIAASLRFWGNEWKTMNPNDLEARIRLFVRHETFHYWGSRLFQFKSETSDPWLHEGTADYFANLGKSDITSVVHACWQSRPLGRVPTSGRSVYDCGHAINLLGDVLLKGTGLTMVDVWRRIFNDSGDSYDVNDFFNNANQLGMSDDFETLAMVFLRSSEQAELEPIIRRTGITGNYGVLDESKASFALMHILSSNCTGSHGFWMEKDRLRLDAPNCVGGLEGRDRTEVVSIDGTNLLQDARAVFKAVNVKCGTDQPLRFSTPEGENFLVKCGRSISVE